MTTLTTDYPTEGPLLAGLLLAGLLVSTGCVPAGGSEPAGPDAARPDASTTDTAPDEPLPYARRVIDFRPGSGAGHGRDQLPDIVLGPPTSSGVANPSQDVLTLGDDGEIVVGFGDDTLVDGPGADLVVYENPFLIGGNPDQVYAELGEVAVSVDGDNWTSFRCDPSDNEAGEWPGCAGWRPVRSYDPTAVIPLDPAITGGDPFDLADIGVERANYIRITDRSSAEVTGPTVNGFDLDAVGAVHLE